MGHPLPTHSLSFLEPVAGEMRRQFLRFSDLPRQPGCSKTSLAQDGPNRRDIPIVRGTVVLPIESYVSDVA